MYRWLTVLVLSTILMVPCFALTRDEANDFISIHESVVKRFQPQEYSGEFGIPERFNYYSSLHTVVGDCDDFASAIYYELWKRGYEPRAITYDRIVDGVIDYRHAIVCTDEVCFDSNYVGPYMRAKFDGYVDSVDFKVVIIGEFKTLPMYDLEIYETIVWIASQAA